MAIKHFNAILKDGLYDNVGDERINILVFDVFRVRSSVF